MMMGQKVAVLERLAKQMLWVKHSWNAFDCQDVKELETFGQTTASCTIFFSKTQENNSKRNNSSRIRFYTRRDFFLHFSFLQNRRSTFQPLKKKLTHIVKKQWTLLTKRTRLQVGNFLNKNPRLPTANSSNSYWHVLYAL